MADTSGHDATGHDDFSDVEALLRELDHGDLEMLAPPADVWEGIEREIDDSSDTATIGPVVSLADRRWVRPVLAVAAALVIVVVGAAVVFTRGDDADVLATVELSHDAATFDPLGAEAAATAELVERDGMFEIVLTDSSLPSDLDADLELWLIEADDDGNLVDIAPVALVSGAGSYAVPDSIDVDTHRIVDISVEPRDGDESHSGRSILRGTLDA